MKAHDRLTGRTSTIDPPRGTLHPALFCLALLAVCVAGLTLPILIGVR